MLRVWDLVRAPRAEKMGFSRGIEGNIFIFLDWGGARRDVALEAGDTEARSTQPGKALAHLLLLLLRQKVNQSADNLIEPIVVLSGGRRPACFN